MAKSIIIIITAMLIIQSHNLKQPDVEQPIVKGMSEVNTSLIGTVNEIAAYEEKDKPQPKEPKKEEVEPVKSDVEVEPTHEIKPASKYLAKWFNNKTGQTHWDICKSKEVGRKFVDAFAEFGQDAQVIACVTLNHENGVVGGDYITNAVSPCWSTNQAQAKARKCNYASDNSAGVDAGLFMINTYYQAKRITKLGGPACNFVDSRNPSDSCNVQKITWLHDLNNQIAIIKDIYREQGFNPWVAFNRHVKPYL